MDALRGLRTFQNTQGEGLPTSKAYAVLCEIALQPEQCP